MFHLTAEINNIDFPNGLHIDNGNRFVVTSNDMELNFGEEDEHGYNVLFKNNGHTIADFHSVMVEDFVLDVKSHSLKASFLIDIMAPFEELDKTIHPDFLFSMHNIGDCLSGNNNADCAFNKSQSNDIDVKDETVSQSAGVKSVTDQVISLDKSATSQPVVAAKSSTSAVIIKDNVSDSSTASESIEVSDTNSMFEGKKGA